MPRTTYLRIVFGSRPTWARCRRSSLIAAFCDQIAGLAPQLVTFNGDFLDLPFLRYRAMIYGVSAPGLVARPYFNRYTEDAVDLCDILSSFAPHSKASLNELSKIMGMPRKPEGIDGTDIERYFLEGRVKEIAERDGRRQHLPCLVEVRAIPGPTERERA
jgi:predicted PolB exonuclease-like 3'-5' exonuclease